MKYLKEICLIVISLLMITVKCKSQTIENVCSNNNLPPGWYVVDINKNCKCCGFIKGDTIKYYQYTIQNIDILPINSIVKVCTKNTLPKGWIVINRVKKCLNCKDTSQDQYTIKKVWTQKESLPKIHLDIGSN